jgi:hypothetical protein
MNESTLFIAAVLFFASLWLFLRWIEDVPDEGDIVSTGRHYGEDDS